MRVAQAPVSTAAANKVLQTMSHKHCPKVCGEVTWDEPGCASLKLLFKHGYLVI